MLAALGSWSYRRRRWVMAAWAVIFVVGIGVGGQVFGQLKDGSGGSGSESVKGFNLMDDASPNGPSVIALIDGRRVGDPATRTAVLVAKTKVERLPDITDVTTAYDVKDARLRATDGRSSLMLITVKKRPHCSAASPPTRSPPGSGRRSPRPTSCSRFDWARTPTSATTAAAAAARPR